LAVADDIALILLFDSCNFRFLFVPLFDAAASADKHDDSMSSSKSNWTSSHLFF
jgi:hypothetical protein